MYVELTETAAGFLAKNTGEEVTRYLVITMPKVLLTSNLFKNDDYGIYCLNASIDHDPSFERAKKTFKELKKSLRKNCYETIIVEVKLVKKK